MKKLNILIVCDSITHQKGGAFISPLRFAKLLIKKGHKVVFLSAKYPNTPAIDYLDKIKIYRHRSFAIPKFEKLIRLSFPKKMEIDEIIKQEKIDVVHIMEPTPSARRSLKVANKLGIKSVSHSHTQPENIIIHFPKFMQKKFVNKLLYYYITNIYNKTEITICPSKFSEKLLIKNNRSATTVVSNGVDLSKFKNKSPILFIKKFKLNPKHKRILFVGRLHPEKSISTLIEAIPYISKKSNVFHIDIVGGGYLRDSLEKQALDLGVDDKVTFFGKVSDEDLLLAYNASDIFVLPSLAELEGMVVLEAMACGKPIVIANSPESASVDFVEGNGFLFKSQDPKDLADKVLKLLKDDKLRKSMGKKSTLLVKEFDINESVNKLEKIYQGVLSKK